MAKIIGLDLGTTTVSGVLFDAERGQVRRSAQRSNDAAIRDCPPTRAEQDAHRLQILTIEVLAELAAGHDRREEKPRPVDGIALTGQKHGLLCADRQGEPLTPLISWQDQRTSEATQTADQSGRAESGAGTSLERLADRLRDLDWRENGCRIAHGYGAATLFWLAERAQVPSRTRWVCSAANWLSSRLTGRPPVMDPTHAASWGVYHLRDSAWNSAFLNRLDLDPRLFPPLRPPGERVGGLAPSVAHRTGLPAGLPVFNALGDTQAAFLGAAISLAEKKDDLPLEQIAVRDVLQPPSSGPGASVKQELEQILLLNLGTGGQICWAVPAFELPSTQVETRPLAHHRFLRVGASLCGGSAYAWLNRTVRDWLREFGVDAGEEAVYERLNTLARASEEMNGLQVRTTFLGARGDPAQQSAQSSSGGAIEGITLDNLQLGRLARATLAGMVAELHDLYQSGRGGESPGASVGRRYVIATGGAVHKNSLLPRLIEERVGLPVHQPAQREVAAMGTAWLAADAIGS
jgi:sugar (pentulose or hexulose) kinase